MKKDTKEFMKAEATKLTGAKAGVPTRNVQFEQPASVPRYFAYNGSAVGTTLMAILSAIFPEGERFFVESVRRFRDRAGDEILAAKISGFIGQESMHGREHERLNEFFLARGFDMAAPEAVVKAGLWFMEQFSPTQQLACTAFMEHFTAHLAEQWLTHQEFRGSTEPEMLKLWTWHGIEELEHKEVAFDLLQRVSANEHLERILAFPIVLVGLAPGLFSVWAYLVAREGKFFDVVRNARDLWALFRPGGFLTNCLVRLPEFFAKDFHPNDQDTDQLLKEFREKYFTPGGELKVEFKNREAVERAAS